MQQRLVTSNILSRLSDYGSRLQSWVHPILSSSLSRKFKNFAARLLAAPRHQHSTPLLEKLLWLPISEHIKYKVACMCFTAKNGSGQSCLPLWTATSVHVNTCRTLRSSSDTRMLKFHSLVAFAPPLVWDPIFVNHYKIDTAQPNWKPSAFTHSIFAPTSISTQSVSATLIVWSLMHVIPSTLKIFGQKGAMPPHYRLMCACVSVCAQRVCDVHSFLYTFFICRKNDCA